MIAGAPAPRAGRLAWAGAAALLGLVALAGHAIGREAIDWQPGRTLVEPWRAYTAVGVHYSDLHLRANLAGLALTAVLGWVADPPARVAGAWLVAWPATQLGLGLAPEVLHYGGLSGVLHAGVATLAAFGIVGGSRAQRTVGAAIALGLTAKVVAEAPWGPALRHPAGWDIATVPLAHATGAVAGAVAGALAGAWGARPGASRGAGAGKTSGETSATGAATRTGGATGARPRG